MSTGELAKSASDGNEEDVGRRRLQIDFSSEAYSRLIELRRESDVKTNTEVVRNALRLFQWFLRAKKDGFRIQLVKDDVVREVEIIF